MKFEIVKYKGRWAIFDNVACVYYFGKLEKLKIRVKEWNKFNSEKWNNKK
jgi:hypothetical protein